MSRYRSKLDKIIEAFFERQPERGWLQKYQGGCWRKKEEQLYVPMPRDEVFVRGETAIYLLWGNEIASWDGETLCLNKHNIYHTRLTADRLIKILCRFVSYKVGYKLHHTLNDQQKDTWYKIRAKLPYIVPRGFYYNWRVIHPFPLIIKASTLEVKFDKEIYIKKLLRSRTHTQEYLNIMNRLNIPIPEERKGDVAAKMFQRALDSYIAA